MKNILVLLPLLITVNGCKNSYKDNKGSDLEPDRTKLADLKFLKKKIDFGNVPSDTVLTGRYDFLNPSGDTLIITSVNPDCTCTGFTLNNEKTPPGDSGYVLLKVSTKNKLGPVVLYSTISANTPTRLYSLKMMANVK